MSKKREIEQLISDASGQGIRFEYLASGHWKAVNPKTKKKVFISSTPKSDRGVFNARASLKKIGYVTKRPPKKKRHKKSSEAEVMALKVVTSSPTSQEDSMPKLGEIAEIKTALSTDEVSSNVPMAAYVLWEAIHLRMKSAASSPTYEERSKEIGGKPGKVWEGSRRNLMQDLWPDLALHTMNRIGQYLTGSKNMTTIERGRGGMESIWWISDEFNTATEYKAKHTHADWSDPKPKSKSNRGQRGRFSTLEPGADGYYRCEKCTFATKTVRSFQPHIGKLGDREHPCTGSYHCSYCPDILPTPEQMQAHHSRRHKDEHLNYCAKCVGYYEGSPYAHRVVHLESKTSPETENSENVVTKSKDESLPIEISTDLEVAEKALWSILEELKRLRDENETLRQENKELVSSIESFKDIAEPLQRMFSKLNG